jgi:hypothetical protein
MRAALAVSLLATCTVQRIVDQTEPRHQDPFPNPPDSSAGNRRRPFMGAAAACSVNRPPLRLYSQFGLQQRRDRTARATPRPAGTTELPPRLHASPSSGVSGQLPKARARTTFSAGKAAVDQGAAGAAAGGPRCCEMRGTSSSTFHSWIWEAGRAPPIAIDGN